MPGAWQACHPERTLESWRRLALAFGGRMDSGSLMRADLWTYLSENCLVKTDRAGMFHSLEVRVPMLSNALLDRALALPAQVHFDQGCGKAILRRLARKHLPEPVWNRPKHGFSVPLQRDGLPRFWMGTRSKRCGQAPRPARLPGVLPILF